MKMDWKNNKLLFIVIAVAVFNLVFIVGYKLMVRQVTTQVINNLQKEYSPGQAYPGIDPDKVGRQSLFEELQKRQDNQPVIQESPQDNTPRPEVAGASLDRTVWRDQWERERGAVE
jgi:hypothetical protein